MKKDAKEIIPEIHNYINRVGHTTDWRLVNKYEINRGYQLVVVSSTIQIQILQ